MKVAITVTILFACAGLSSAAFLPLSLGPFPAMTEMDSADLAYLRQQYSTRPKRAGSGSGDVLNTLKASIGQGIKSKLGMIGKASSGHFSGSPHYYPHDDHKPPFDVWAFKKSLLYTLLQAVKAIKGGVIAIKGQLIKGGGQLLATKGTIIKGGGEALSNLGKSIASSAFMIVPQHDDYEEHYEHVPSGYGHSGPGPEVHHSGPSASGPEYGPPGYHQKYNSVYDGKHEHDGVIILKKIPHGHGHVHGHGHGHGEHEGQETVKTETEFKPLKDDTYAGVRHIMGQVFSASSSSTPDQPPHKPKHHEYAPQKNHESYPPQPQKQFEYPQKQFEYPPQKQHEYPPQKQHEYPPHPQKQIEYSPQKYELYTSQKHYDQYPPQKQYEQPQPTKHIDQELSPDIPATSYGVPTGPKVKYPEYYIAPANTVSQNHNKPLMFVTPSPPTETDVPITYKLELPTKLNHQKDNQIFIGMNVPLEYPNQELSQDYLTEFKLSPTPYSQNIPTKFLINYPDPTELSLLKDSFTQQSRHVPKRLTRPQKSVKKSPNLDIVRSVSFELRPDARLPLKI